MDQVFQDYLTELEALHSDLEKTIAGLSPEAVNWSPGPGINSIAVLIVHLTGAQRFWIGDVALGEPSGRDRDAEFRAEGWDEAGLKRRLDESLSYVRGALERLHAVDLPAGRPSPRGGKPTTVAFCLYHVLRHTGEHAGHAGLTRQWWELRQV